MLKRAVRLLAETKGEAWVNKANVWPMIKRLDPTFDTEDRAGSCHKRFCSAMAR